MTARTENGRFDFSLNEPKQGFYRSTENWGREPLRSVTQGHYGLGLHRTRGIIEAHGGELKARYEEANSSLITTVTLPVAPAAAITAPDYFRFCRMKPGVRTSIALSVYASSPNNDDLASVAAP